ncbi:MAG: tetratricopeptide repeat protein, partial [Phycisphaerales bacterium]|nr:tetratricopeptide repeat protein [Phycisphaerales bacterium]
SKPDTEAKEPPRKLQFKIRKLLSLLGPFDSTIGWLMATQAIAEGNHEHAAPILEQAMKSDTAYPDLFIQVGNCYLQMEYWEKAHDAFQKAIANDSENSSGFLGLARSCLELGRNEEAIDHALTTTELLYANPMAHYVLGKALWNTGDFATAQTALGVAVAQAPGFADAHLALADLFENHLEEPEKAEFHRKLVAESAAGTEAKAQDIDAVQADIAARRSARRPNREEHAAFPDTPAEDIITIVSGLPRSGTSMMMQMLVDGGLQPFTDEQREADSDNPKGYYEHEKATQLQRDSSWVPEARGKAVKIVAQLLPALPTTEKYRVIFMDRDLREIVNSQKVMLDRLGRKGGTLDDGNMMLTLDRQVEHVEQVLGSRPEIEFLFMDYTEPLEDPASACHRINTFLGGILDESKAMAAIDGSLRRQQASNEPTHDPEA